MTTPTPESVKALADGLTAASQRAMLKASLTWTTCSENGMTGMAATLLATRIDPLLERRWSSWGSDRRSFIRAGAAYEYRCSPLGLPVRDYLRSASHE